MSNLHVRTDSPARTCHELEDRDVLEPFELAELRESRMFTILFRFRFAEKNNNRNHKSPFAIQVETSNCSRNSSRA